MSQIRVSEETYGRLVRVKAKLEEWSGRSMSFCDTVRFLCEVFEENWRDSSRIPSMEIHQLRRVLNKAL